MPLAIQMHTLTTTKPVNIYNMELSNNSMVTYISKNENQSMVDKQCVYNTTNDKECAPYQVLMGAERMVAMLYKWLC